MRGSTIRADERDKLISMLRRLPIGEVAKLSGRSILTLAKLAREAA
ncbi:hypothetical protein Pan3_53 [Pseudanabaena phage Pan3]|nr:hypothetical protein Pan3_53 [Pseudanabaena phage Pan3]